jgi:hypothetical protein
MTARMTTVSKRLRKETDTWGPSAHHDGVGATLPNHRRSIWHPWSRKFVLSWP